MGKGQDKIARTLLEMQPTAIVELFLIYFNPKDSPDSFFGFHGGSLFQKPITWQGIEYLPLPAEMEGFETNANGRIARPRIKISNKDYIITDLLLQYNDLQFSKLIRKRTFIKFLDNINFPNGNPWGQQDFTAELSNDSFVVSQKLAENKLFVEFELTSPLDIDGLDVNNRKILSNYCSFAYRGDGCCYKGLPVTNSKNEDLNISPRSLGAFQNGDPFNSFEWINNFFYKKGDIIYIENKDYPINNFTSRVPSKNVLIFDRKEFLKTYYVSKSDHTSSQTNSPRSINSDTYWQKDECNKTINGCKKRFNTDAYTKLYTGTTVLSDYYIDFTSGKIPTSIGENTGLHLRLTSNTNISNYFDTGFYKNTFTIAMWVSMNKATATANIPYSIFTNATPTASQDGYEGRNSINYYLWNMGLYQNVNVIKSDGTIKTNPNGIDGPAFYIGAGNLTADSSYQFLLFECENPTTAGGYVQISLNDNTPSRLSLGAGEKFAFAVDQYQQYSTGFFRINSNNIWGTWHDQRPRIAPIGIHGLGIWSRQLTDSEKLWLKRKNTEPNSREISETLRFPRKLSDLTPEYASISGDRMQVYFEDSIGEYHVGNKMHSWNASLIKPNQLSSNVELQVNALNFDIRNNKSGTFSGEYSYTKTPDNWVPFGGFPATHKFSYGDY